MLYQQERQDVCEVTKMMFNRFVTNAAGGNISVKINHEHFIMTPTLMAQQKFCDLSPDDILVLTRDGEIIEGKGNITREFNMHIGTYDTLPNAQAIIHAHPKELMVFASLGLEVSHLTESTRKLGEVKTLPYAPATSMELAEVVKTYMRSRKSDIPVATLLREHGVLIADTSLRKAYDMLERLEYEAYVNFQAAVIGALGLYKGEK
ncbi:class II aldolase/adducin family protein [Heyndrickxia ginsengihumi]|uniref:Class II aldolase/adducin N-terminal domain-containing protein n=1 Tax=Heyndrickxia ginsengihumi TaxID=363870 RepID=A0A6M0P454_9BACI|nr:class II aldolase/adducin family protein [Heyndrickxia ginsengihumi]MBE6184086.1 hypothetical protein [Bacillus sp. (in: firmicutes)]MCM3023026.1 class II aldolase/adducin family protein [Heyndrickxia ginsengihumi]NEY19496.1 hypothetical protein [Heyndrickxia ginsengihumi]